MKKDLNIYIGQISRIIGELKQNNPDVNKLSELEQSLELLSQKIKTAKLYRPETGTNGDQNVHQDASFFCDSDFKIVRYTGYFNNILGKQNNPYSPKINELFDADSQIVFRKKAEQLLETGERQQFSAKIISVNRILLPVEVLLEKIILGNGKEHISAGLVFSEQNPEDLKDYQDILIENLPDMDVCLFDNNLTHMMAGGKEKERYKLTDAGFTGKTFFEVYEEKIQKRLYPFYKNALDGKVSEGEVRIKNQIYFISSTPVKNINNDVVGGALIAQNVTKEKEVEQKLIQSKKEAEEADRTKSLFLARMSHEMRTPLNAIIGFNGLFNKTDLTSKQKEFSHLIGQSADHLLSVVNEILFLFKLGMGKVYIEKIPFDMHDLLTSVYESLQMHAKNKEIRFLLDVDENVPQIIEGDPFRIKQILTNIVSNAIKFTEEGSVTLKVSAEKLKKKKVQVKFEVIDTGIGISQQELDKIYDEFSQSDFNKDKSRKGAGLGLTISKKLVGLLNGRMSVKSELNVGSTFVLVLPFSRSKSEEAIVKERKYDISYNQLVGKKVLYADDDENNILLAKNILADWKTDFTIAVDGADALIAIQKAKFDIILLDIHMPGFSGLEVMRRIRGDKDAINNDTKAMAVTANILKSDIDNYMKSGFDDYILKPFREENLYSKICGMLDLEYCEESGNESESEVKNTSSTGFDISMLEKASGNKPAFFNRMLETFIANAGQAKKDMETALADKNWEKAGEKAHKAIPSFKYFGLNSTVEYMMQLEDATLRHREYEKAAPLIQSLIEDIEKVIHLAEAAKMNEGE